MEWGRWLLAGAAMLAVATLIYKGATLGWGGMPPMAPLIVGLLAAAAVAAFLGPPWWPLGLAIPAVLISLLFGFSTGFMIGPTLLSLAGATVTAKKPVPVAAS